MSRREVSISDNLSRTISVLASVVGILLLLLILFLRLEAVFSMNINVEIIRVLKLVQEWATIAVIILVGLEAVVKKGLIVFLVFAVIAAAVVILTFFPNAVNQITGAEQAAVLPFLQ